MASHMFMAIDSIKGESIDANYGNQVEVTGWTWGASQTGSSASGKGAGTAKVSVNDLTYTAVVDCSVPPLLKYLVNGTPFNTATLTICKASGDKPLAYLTVVMSGGIVSNITLNGNPGDEVQTVSVSLNFSQVKVSYTPQTGGTGGASFDMGYNIAKGSSV